MKVLVIGGTGTLSTAIVEECVKRNYEVYVLNRGSHNERLPKNVKALISDINNVKRTKEAIGELMFDVVIDILVFRINNLKKSIDIFSKNCKHYFFISTTGVYKRNGLEPISENSERGRFEWNYNKGKAQCEDYLFENAEKLPFKFTIIRPAVTYGDRRIPYTIVNRKNQWDLVNRILNDKPIITTKNCEYSIVHVSDFSKAVVDMFCNNKAYSEAYHIGVNKTYKWDYVISVIEKKYNKKARIIHINPEDIKKYLPDMYFEVKYNKSDELILNNNKLVDLIPDFVENTALDKGVEKTLNVLECESKNVKSDEEWNNRVDVILYNVRKSNKISKEEEKYVDEYLSTKDLKNIQFNRNKFKLSYFKSKVIMILKKIKHLFK